MFFWCTLVVVVFLVVTCTGQTTDQPSAGTSNEADGDACAGISEYEACIDGECGWFGKSKRCVTCEVLAGLEECVNSVENCVYNEKVGKCQSLVAYNKYLQSQAAADDNADASDGDVCTLFAGKSLECVNSGCGYNSNAPQKSCVSCSTLSTTDCIFYSNCLFVAGSGCITEQEAEAQQRRPPSPAPTSSFNSNELPTSFVILIIVCLVVAIFLILVAACFYLRVVEGRHIGFGGNNDRTRAGGPRLYRLTPSGHFPRTESLMNGGSNVRRASSRRRSSSGRSGGGAVARALASSGTRQRSN